MPHDKPVAVVAGAGPCNGAAPARRFAGAGYAVAILSRRRTTLAPLESELPDARGFVCDLGSPASVDEAFGRQAEHDLLPLSRLRRSGAKARPRPGRSSGQSIPFLFTRLSGPGIDWGKPQCSTILPSSTR